MSKTAKVTVTVADMARDYAAKVSAKRLLKEQINFLDEYIGKAEEALLDAYATQGITSLRVEVGEGEDREAFLVFPKKRLWAKPVDGDYAKAIPALKRIGLADIIKTTFNVQTLSAWVRERLESGDPLPKYFTKVVEVAEKDSMAVNKAKVKKSKLDAVPKKKAGG